MTRRANTNNPSPSICGITLRPAGRALLRLGGCGYLLLCCFPSRLLRLDTEGTDASEKRHPRPFPTKLFPEVPEPADPVMAKGRVEELNGEREERFMCRRPTRRMRRKRTEEKTKKNVGREVRRRPPPREGVVNARWVGVGECKECVGDWWAAREPGLEAVVEEE